MFERILGVLFGATLVTMAFGEQALRSGEGEHTTVENPNDLGYFLITGKATVPDTVPDNIMTL